MRPSRSGWSSSGERPPNYPGEAMNLGVLISGRGSNLTAILGAIRAKRLDASVRLVISNKASAPGLAVAEAAGAPTRVIPHGSFPDRRSFDVALVEALRGASVEWV